MKKRNVKQLAGMSSKKKKWIIVGAIVVVIVVGAISVSGRKQTDSLPQVTVEQAKKQDVTSRVETSGTVESLKVKTYFSPVNAAISSLTYQTGDVVKKGDTLVAFETDSLEQDNEKSQLNKTATVSGSKDTAQKAVESAQKVKDAQAELPTLEQNVKNYQEYVASLKTAISDRTRTLAEDSSKASSDISMALTKAQAELAKMQENMSSLTALQQEQEAKITELTAEISETKKEGGDASEAEHQLNNFNDALKQTKNQIKEQQNYIDEQNDVITQLNVQQIEAQSNAKDADSDEQIVAWQNELEDATTKLSELQAELSEKKTVAEGSSDAGLTQAAKTQLEATDNLAELEAASTQELLEKGRQGIKADFAGIISKEEISEGTTATQGMELVTVSSNEEVAVNVSVSKYDYDKLKEGQKATISIASHSYLGTVSSISKVAQTNEKGAPVISAKVKIDNPDENIFLGVEAKVSIETDTAKNVVCVPASAVNTATDSTFCYVLKDGIVTKQKITTGVTASDYIEVEKGLKAGDEVISELPEGVEAGMTAEAVSGDTEE